MRHQEALLFGRLLRRQLPQRPMKLPKRNIGLKELRTKTAAGIRMPSKTNPIQKGSARSPDSRRDAVGSSIGAGPQASVPSQIAAPSAGISAMKQC